MFVYAINFVLPESKKVKFWTFQAQPGPAQLGLFHPYFVSKSCFRVISMIKIEIFDQSRAISLIFGKIKSKFVHNTFIIYKNGNETSMQSLLKSYSISFIFNNIFCEMKGKKVIYWGRPGGMGDLS